MGVWLQAFVHTVIEHTSMSLGHQCCHSSRNDLLYHQRKNVPGSQRLSYRFATSEKRMLQVRADLLGILGIAYSVIKRHTYAILVPNNPQHIYWNVNVARVLLCLCVVSLWINVLTDGSPGTHTAYRTINMMNPELVSYLWNYDTSRKT